MDLEELQGYFKQIFDPTIDDVERFKIGMEILNKMPIFSFICLAMIIPILVLLLYGTIWLIANALMYLGLNTTSSWLAATILLHIRPLYFIVVRKLYSFTPILIATTIGLYYLGVFSNIVG